MQSLCSSSCSAESDVDLSIGSCTKCRCIDGGRQSSVDNHPSGESSDLSYSDDFSSSHCTKCILNQTTCRACHLLCSNKSNLTNCSTTRQFTYSNKLNEHRKDLSVYQMDYSTHHLQHHRITYNHRTHSIKRRMSDFIPVNCKFTVNSLNKIYHHIMFKILFFLFIVSFVNCDHQRTYVQLTFESEENSPVNSFIGQIRVPDTYHNYTQPPYLILPVNGQQKGICNPNFDLTIDQHTGDIRNAIHLDREKCSLYKFLAISMKGISFQITIRVIDQNDNRPFFTISSINIQLPENLKPNEIRRNLPSAIDYDDGLYGLQNYRIKSGNINNTFKLSTHRENDGVLYVDLQVNSELDREEISNYKLIIEALDGGVPPLTAELEVNIEVLDINDNKPLFNRSVYYAKLQQNATIGTRLIQVHATDKDLDSNGQISYSLQESPNTLKSLNKIVLNNRLFEIDNKGWITLINNPLNLPKSLTTYELIVIARDGGDIPLETNVLVIVSIQQLANNFNLPRINILLLNDNNRPELNESTKVGEIVARIIISDDEESEQSNRVTYKLTLDQSSNKTLTTVNSFKVREIDQNTYLLIVNSKLDRERQEIFDLKLTAYQMNNPLLNSTQHLKINLIDSNDNVPYFVEKVTYIKLNQYSRENTIIYQFKALDNDLPSTNNLTYTLDESRSDKQSLDWFQLDRKTGELKVKKSMNCNENKSPVIVVSVNDGLNEGESTSLIVELQSNNNYVPVFEQTFYNVTVDESASVGFCFLTLVANDLDCGLNSTIHYSLMVTNRADLPWTNSLSAFNLNKTTGELCIGTQLNYEQRHFYELILVASNPSEGQIRLNSTSIVHIYVEDSNNHQPEFITTQYKVNIHENIIPLMANGLPAPILTIKAYDRDTSPNFNTILYSIVSGNDDFAFEIDEQSGRLFLLKPLSSIDSHRELKVSAQDLVGLKSKNMATVNVFVLNSGFQQQYLHFTSNLYNFNLVENALSNTKIGKLSVQTTLSPFDHHVNMYNQTSSQSSNALSSHLLEYVIYSGNDEQYFEIDKNSGDLIVTRNGSKLINSMLDFERIQNLFINVQCRLSSTNKEFIYAYSQVNISLVNLNDNSPEFYNDVSVVSLKENSIRSTTTTPVFAVKSVDNDSGLFGRVRYHFKTVVQDQLETTDQSGPFYMNKFTGEIYITNGELDYEQQSTYELNVMSVDGGGRTNEMQIKVNLIDLSDNSPYFVNKSGQIIRQLNLSVYENMSLGEVVYHFESGDQDENDQTFFYSIVNEKQQLMNKSWTTNRSDCFAFDLTSGELRVNCVLDAEQVYAYALELEVHDIGNNKGQLSLMINLKDVNDNIPQFEKFEYRFQLSEDSAIGSKIGQISAFDPDQGSNGIVQFNLIKNFESTFTLDSKTGELFLAKKLDRECDKERYVLKVQVSDQGEVRLINEKLATIIIDVLDSNDHRPVFLDQHQSISSFIKQQCSNKNVALSHSKKIEQFKLPSNSQISTIVTKIRAYDMDAEENGTIHYAIKSVQQVSQNDGQFVDISNGNRLFDINSDGLITTKQLFANKNQLFRLAIEIEDSKGLKGDHLKSIEILVTSITSSTKQIEKVKNVRSDYEYIEIESLTVGQSIGPIIDLRNFRSSDQQYIKQHMCDDYYLNSAFDDPDQAFTLNISESKINLVSLTNRLESTLRLGLYLNIDCSLSLTRPSPVPQSNGYRRLLTFEIELKMKQTKERPFDCLRNQLKNSEFGDQLMQVNLDLNQEITYEKSIDLYDFKHCSTIQPNQRFKLISLQDDSNKLLNQLKINSDLVLQLSTDNDHLPYDRELLINLQTLSNELSESTTGETDSILVSFVFNKRADLDLNSLKVINEQNVIEFEENCCLSGEVIYQVLLNSDLSENYQVKYSINNQIEYEIFKIDNNGLIRLLKAFDYETKTSYQLNILIEINEQSPSHKPVRRLEHSIKIMINDVNDEIPLISAQKFEIEFPENAPVGILLTKIKATDLDLIDVQNLTYLIPDGYQYKRTFELNAKTGELRLKDTLDREKIASYKIPVLVFDSDYEHHTLTHLTLKLEGIINDNSPQFRQQESTIIIPENVPIKTPVYTFIASDEDEKSQLTYDLINCETCPFELNSKTGELTTKNEIDFEVTSLYNLTVSVTDGLNSNTCNLIIRIKNLNDNSPVLFDGQLHEIKIDLDKITPNDQLSYELNTCKAIDRDKNSKLYYSIKLDTNEAQHFTMNSTTGQLTINQAVLNRLLKSKLYNKSIFVELTIQVIDVTDYNVQTATGRVRIQFSGANYLDELKRELDELKRERIKFSQYPIVIELNEQFLNKKLIHYLVNGEQMKDVKFELVNQTNDFKEQFSLSSKGEFSLRGKLKNRNYECFLMARSEQFGETLNLIQFTRMPMIHSSTQLRKFSFELNLEENLESGHRLIQLEERVNIYLKNDHQFKVIYSSVNVSWFDLDSKTGLLKSAIKFDYEKHPAKMELIVLASLPDSYTNLMIFNLSINLINVNKRLIFNHPIIYTTVNESLPKDTFVCRLSSIDLDDRNETTYHIVEGNRDNAFKIVNNSIYTNVVLDREIREKYTLFIFANNNAASHQSTIKMKSNTFNYQIIEIMVIDLNDNVPYLASNQELTIIENTASQLVGTISSNDVDLYPLMLTYHMLNDSNYDLNQQLFDLNRYTGEIRLKKKIKFNESFTTNQIIDYDSSLREFQFNAIASDSIHQAETRIKIHLKRNSIYQQAPTFSEEIYYVEFEKQNCLNCAIVQVKCNPPVRRSNAGLNESKIKIQYKLIGKANRYFDIDLNDGQIYSNKTLTFNESTGQLFRLIVQSYYAFENGRPINNLKSTATLLIVIKKSKTVGEQSIDSSLLSTTAKRTIELDRYEYGSVVYRLPERSSVRYELESDSFALMKRNQIIILKKPTRIESTLKIKQIERNQTSYRELNIRFAFHHKNTQNQVFKRRLFNIQLNENTTVGQQIIDLKMNGKSNFSFKIQSSNNLNQFKLDHTGVLYLAQRLNCKLINNYNLIIIAKNGLRSDFAVIRIQVLPPLHHLTLPILPLQHYQATINENIPVGTKIIKIMDKNSMSALEGFKFVLVRDYPIDSSPVDHSGRQLFEFDSKTGYLVSASSIDYETLVEDVINYKLGLQFINSNYYGKPFHNGTSGLMNLNSRKSNTILNPSSIRIKVNSEDEFYPKFEKSLYDFKVEMLPNETGNVWVVGQVHAEDGDRGKDGEVVYSINSTVPSWTRELFKINENNGILTMNLQGNNALINNWLQTLNAYTSMIVIANSPKTNSLSSMAMVDITIQSNKQTKTGNELRNLIKGGANKVNQMNSVNKGVLAGYESSNELKSQPQSTLPTIKQSTSQSNNIIRTMNESINGQRKQLPNNLIQVYGIVIGLLVLLIILILFSVVLLYRICNLNRKDTTSSNNSIYNSKTQSNYDPNSQHTKSMSCLIKHQNSSDPIIDQHNKLKQADFMINMAMQRNSIIYQEQHTNSSYLNSNTSLIKPTDTLSNCNTSITILHSHENSETKSTSEQHFDSTIKQEIAPKRIVSANLSGHSSRSSENSHQNSNFIKNRPLPANPPDIVNSYQEVKYYDEVQGECPYYSNYKELENSFNHNYEAISPAYDEQVQFFQNSWSPAYHPVTEILSDANVLNSIAKSKVKLLSSPTDSKHRSSVKTAKLASTNKLA